MLKSTFAALALSFAAAMTSPAQAGDRAFIKSNGSDALNCADVANACATMIRALTVAGANGEVVCFDRAPFGNTAITITQSVTISCGDGLWNFDSAIFFLTVTTPANSVVVIEGFVGDAQGSSGDIIRFNGQGTLHLRNIRAGNITIGSGHALNFTPNGPASLHISDSNFYRMGGSGVFIQPQAGGYANVHIRNSRFEKNGNGIFADGAGSTIGININIDASAAVDNALNGIGAFNNTAGGAPIVVSVKNTQITGNLINGLGSLGTNASGQGSSVIEVNNCMITGNNNGLAVGGTGQILTFGNNQVRRNSVNGAFTGSAALQ